MFSVLAFRAALSANVKRSAYRKLGYASAGCLVNNNEWFCPVIPVGGRPSSDSGDYGYSHLDLDWLGRFWKKAFFRPKPVITGQLVRSPTFLRTHVGLLIPELKGKTFVAKSASELWINVRNDGKSPVRNMRARAKIRVLPNSLLAEWSKESAKHLPVGVTKLEWDNYVKQSSVDKAEFASDIFFGTYLPFTKGSPFAHTPKGTIAMPWETVAEPEEWEIDLPPKSDEASVRIALVCELLDEYKTGFEKLFGVKTGQLGNTMVQFGIFAPSFVKKGDSVEESTPYDLAVKFWVIADNLAYDLSAMFHIQIPSTYDTINWSPVKKNSVEYKELDKLFRIKPVSSDEST